MHFKKQYCFIYVEYTIYIIFICEKVQKKAKVAVAHVRKINRMQVRWFNTLLITI